MSTPQYVELRIGSNANGTPVTVKALAPVIVSASRSTDIPAFYAEWLINRLKDGYCIWYNPFNRKPSYVSFSKARVFVFWSKNPAPLLPHLEEFDRRGFGYYFQFTLNDYVLENFEPNVGLLKNRIETFKELSARIGPKRIIWRFDPIIMIPGRSPTSIIKKIRFIGNELKGCTEKLVFSFIDVEAYRKVQNNMKKNELFKEKDVLSAEATDAQIGEICEGLAALRDEWEREGWELTLATCAEKVDLKEYGIEHNRCIDDILLRQLYPHDDALMEYLGEKRATHGSLLTAGAATNPPIPLESNPRLKDKGQREACGCIVSKDIGMYNTCMHSCAYCYANSSVNAVSENYEKYLPDNKSIINIAFD